MHPSCPVGPGRNFKLRSSKDLVRGCELWTRGGLSGIQREIFLTSFLGFVSPDVPYLAQLCAEIYNLYSSDSWHVI